MKQRPPSTHSSPADIAKPSHQAKRVMLMTVAMLSVPLAAGFAKYLGTSYSPLFISWARYAIACLVVLPFAAAVKGRRLFPAERQTSHVLRTASSGPRGLPLRGKEAT